MNRPRVLACLSGRDSLSNLSSWYEALRGGSDSYMGRNPGVSKVGEESAMALDIRENHASPWAAAWG